MKNQKHTSLLLALPLVTLISAALSVQGDDPKFNDRRFLPPINVTNAVINAIENHPQAQIARVQQKIARQNARSASADLGPSASATYGYAENKNPQSLGVGHSRSGLAGLTLTQTILNLQTKRAYDAAKIRIKAASLSTQNNDLKLAGQVITSYLDVLKLRLTLGFAVEHYQDLNALKASMTDGSGFEGKVTAQDIELVEGYKQTAKGDKSKLNSDAEQAESEFLKNTRLSATGFFLIEPLPLLIPKDAEAAKEIAFKNNPDLATDRVNLEATQKDLSAARGARLPKVEGKVSAYHLIRPEGDFKEYRNKGVSAEVSVTVPLSFRRQNAAVAVQKGNHEASQLALQMKILSLETDLRKAYVDIRDRTETLKSLCQGVKSRLEAVRLMRSRLFSGITVQEFLLQKQELVKAAISLNDEFMSKIIDSYNVHIHMGTLIENLPPPVDSSRVTGPNPQPLGERVYEALIERCNALALL